MMMIYAMLFFDEGERAHRSTKFSEPLAVGVLLRNFLLVSLPAPARLYAKGADAIFGRRLA